MKKVSLLLLVSYALCLLGCEPAELESNQTTGERLVRIGVSAESSGTKVAIANDLSFSWTVGDRIAVWAGEGYCISEPYVSGNTFDVFLNGTRANYAVYPASSAVAAHATASSLQVSLPTEYTIASGQSNDYSPLPMIAANAENSDLAFKHLGGLIRLSVTDIPTTTTKIVVDLGQKIAGTFEVQNPAAVGTADCKIVAGTGSTAVTFHLAEACEEVTLNLPVPTGTYTSITVTALNATNTVLETWTPTISWICARAHGKKLEPAVSTESMRLIISTSETLGRIYRLPFGANMELPTDLTIDWGDGTSVDTYPSGTTITISDLTHTYASEVDGDHTITITSTFASNYAGARIPDIWSNVTYDYPYLLKALPDPILKTTNSHISFTRCGNLESICGDLFFNNPDIPNFDYTFYACTSLIEIPENLFANNSNATSFKSTFELCWSLSHIPEGLFSNNTAAVSFERTFCNCGGYFNSMTGLSGSSIPENLFANNTAAKIFKLTFAWSCNLTGSIPEDLFANNPNATSFEGTFILTGLTGSIPENLFANNQNVTTFNATFSGCAGLTGTIPENLFANNPNVTTFYGTFSQCSGLTGGIPENLFANNPDVTTFGVTFSQCSGLTGSIPEGLFANNPNVTTFEGCFGACTGLSGTIPEDLFANNPNVTVFRGTFNGCSGLTGSIPEDLFANNTSVTTFSVTFNLCSGLTGSIPEGLFANNPNVTAFEGCFEACTGLFGNIPEGLFENNLSVTNFYSTFRGCTGLSGSIPAGLFAHNLNVTNFMGTFENCVNLQVCSDIFIRTSINDKTNRFSNISNITFEGCFFRTGSSLSSAGTAPDLWNYTLPATVTKTQCFAGGPGVSRFTNGSDIPAEWQ